METETLKQPEVKKPDSVSDMLEGMYALAIDHAIEIVKTQNNINYFAAIGLIEKLKALKK